MHVILNCSAIKVKVTYNTFKFYIHLNFKLTPKVIVKRGMLKLILQKITQKRIIGCTKIACMFFDYTATPRQNIDIMHFGDVVVGTKCQLSPDTQSTNPIGSNYALNDELS